MLTKEQLENRKGGLGGSDIAAILGLDPYKTAMQLWLEKTGRLDPEDISEKPEVYWGNILEPVVADEYARRTGYEIAIETATLKHPKYPWLLGHIDRRIVGLRKLLECKTASFRSALKEWGDPASYMIPQRYIIQVLHYMSIGDFEEADLAALLAGNDYRIYEIPRDEEIIAEMTDRANDFWHNNVLADIPPQPTSRLEVQQLYPRHNGKFIDAPPESLILISEYNKIKNEIAILEENKKKQEAEITKLIGESSGLKVANQVIATWKANINGTRVLNTRKQG